MTEHPRADEAHKAATLPTPAAAGDAELAKRLGCWAGDLEYHSRDGFDLVRVCALNELGVALGTGTELSSLIRSAIALLTTPPEPAAQPGEYPPCEDCGGPPLTWFAPHGEWNRVMGGSGAKKDDPGGMLCPNCFIKRAEATQTSPRAWLVSQEAQVAGEFERGIEAAAKVAGEYATLWAGGSGNWHIAGIRTGAGREIEAAILALKPGEK